MYLSKIASMRRLPPKTRLALLPQFLADPTAHAGKVYPLYGPVELTQEEIARAVGKVLGIDVPV